MVKRIEGRKINLRQVTKADAWDIYRYAADEAISRYTHVPHPYKLEDAYDFIKHTQSARRKKTAYHFGIEDKKTGKIIGMIGLITVDYESRKGEIGYWVAKPFWGKGIMTEVVSLILEFLFVTIKLHRVYAHVFPENEASIYLLKNCGFVREGFIREGFVQRGNYVSVYLYSILEDDWGKRALPVRFQIAIRR